MVSINNLHALREKLSLVGRDYAGTGELLPTGWAGVDDTLDGGLLRGALHEWLGLTSIRNGDTARRTWTPPVCVLVHLAWRALETGSRLRRAAWVGRRCFPCPSVLVRGRDADRRLLEHSLFINTRNAASRLWAIDLALRSPSVGVVIADGSTFSMAATRRVQLLAKRHDTLALLVRPPWEEGELSAAQSRWLMRWQPHRSVTENVLLKPRWSARLLRCKGVPTETKRHLWTLEWNSDTSTLHLSAELAHPAGAAPEEQTRHARRRTSRPA